MSLSTLEARIQKPMRLSVGNRRFQKASRNWWGCISRDLIIATKNDYFKFYNNDAKVILPIVNTYLIDNLSDQEDALKASCTT